MADILNWLAFDFSKKPSPEAQKQEEEDASFQETKTDEKASEKATVFGGVDNVASSLFEKTAEAAAKPPQREANYHYGVSPVKEVKKGSSKKKRAKPSAGDDGKSFSKQDSGDFGD